MELSPYVSALRDNLTAAAAAGDEQTRVAARVLAATIEPAARLALMNALSDLAAEVTLALENQVVEVRLDGQDVQVVVTGAPVTEEPEPAEEPPQPSFDPTGDISRITVRLLEELKTKAEQTAASQGVSLNAFVSQAVQGALSNAQRQAHGGGRGQARENWGGGEWRQHWDDFGRTMRASFGQWGEEQRGGSGSSSDSAPGKPATDKPWQADEPQGKGSSRVRGWVEG